MGAVLHLVRTAPICFFCVSAHNAKSHYTDAPVEYQSSLRRVNRVLRTIASFPRLLRTGSA